MSIIFAEVEEHHERYYKIKLINFIQTFGFILSGQSYNKTN